MAEVQPSTSPSPPRAAGGDPEDPPLAPPMQQQREGGGDLAEEEETLSPPPPQSTTVPISNAAPYIPQPDPQTLPQPQELVPPLWQLQQVYLSLPDITYRKQRTVALQGATLAVRAAAAGLCLAALVVQAADTRKDTQLRYSEAVNVIGFLYSVFQFFALALHWLTMRHLISRPKGDYFDFTMDQVLAYLLISSSSSATTRVSDWINHWGSYPFPTVANSSIVISFLAFIVFTINSLISAYNLFHREPLPTAAVGIASTAAVTRIGGRPLA